MNETATPTPDTRAGAYVFHAVGKDLTWDYVRGGFAVFVVGGVLGVMIPYTIAWYILLALFIAILGYIFNTIYRHGLRIEMDDEGVTSGWRNPMDVNGATLLAKKHLPWSGLSSFYMRHFSRKLNETDEGWIMLRLNGARVDGRQVKITFDGTHEGFKPVLARAWDHARAKGILLDEATTDTDGGRLVEALRATSWRACPACCRKLPGISCSGTAR